MKKVKERSRIEKSLRDKKDKGKIKNKNNIIILVVCVLVTIAVLFAVAHLIEEKNNEKAVEFVTSPGAPSTRVSKEFLNLLIADMKYNGISDDGKLTEYAVESASIYLQTEYYCDNVYNVSLDAEQQNSIDEAINRLINKHGSENGLERYLSRYGTDVDALKRYFELSLKQSNVLSYLERSVTLDQMKDYFADNYMSVDLVVVFDNDENPEFINDVHRRIVGGEMTMDEARELYSRDELKDYKAAFYVSKANLEGVDEALFDKISSMKENEISVLDMGNFGYIIRRNPADTDAFAQNEELYEGIKDTVKEQLYKSMCDMAKEAISVNESVVGKIDPSKISPLNISSLTGF